MTDVDETLPIAYLPITQLQVVLEGLAGPNVGLAIFLRKGDVMPTLMIGSVNQHGAGQGSLNTYSCGVALMHRTLAQAALAKHHESEMGENDHG